MKHVYGINGKLLKHWKNDSQYLILLVIHYQVLPYPTYHHSAKPGIIIGLTQITFWHFKHTSLVFIDWLHCFTGSSHDSIWNSLFKASRFFSSASVYRSGLPWSDSVIRSVLQMLLDMVESSPCGPNPRLCMFSDVRKCSIASLQN